MFKEIFWFELSYRFKRPATWAYFGILVAFGLFFTIGDNGLASEKVFVDGPFTISQTLNVVSIFAIMIASAIMGVPVYRDVEHKTDNYFFSYPISENGYLLGRYLGSLTTLFLVSSGLQLGLILGAAVGPYLGFVEPERYLGFNFWNYLQPTITLYWTNLFFAGSIFFALVSLTKRVMLAYAGGAVLFIIYLVTLTLTQDIENKDLTALMDPFGLSALQNLTQYWTPEEQNTQLIPFKGVLFWNRLIWVGLGLLLLIYTLFRFNFTSFLTTSYGKKGKKIEDSSAKIGATEKLPKVSQVFTMGFYTKTFFQLTWLEFKNIISDNFFKAILIAAVAFLFFDGWFGAPIYGTPSLPLTNYMLEVKDYNYIILVFVLIVFMSGEVLHRERKVKYDQIFGALPIPNAIIYWAKFCSLVLLAFLLVNMILISGVLNQIFQGYFNFEFGKYFTELYLFELPKYVSYVLMAFFIHSIITKKFLAHVVAIGFWVVLFAINSLADVDNNMLLYSYTPYYIISDMNGFGHFTKGALYFRVYWLFFGFILFVIGYLFWKRGSDSGIKARFKAAKGRMNYKVIGSMSLLLLGFVSLAIFINKNIREYNTYRTADEGIEARANYEKQLAKYDKIAQPKVVDVKLNADLVPEDRTATIKSDYIITNKTGETITQLHLNWGAGNLLKKEVKEFTINGKKPRLSKEYKEFGYKIYDFDTPMKPGDTLQMRLEVFAYYKGFPNEGFGNALIANGTFMNDNFFPSFGYSAQGELSSDKDRKEQGLPEKEYALPSRDDKWGVSNLLFNDDADYISFEGTVSTAPNQIAVLPGYLQKEWTENGRRYFTYKMEGEMDFFYNISSAAYAVHKDKWLGGKGEEVAIEIFHHPTHIYNLDRFVNGVKKSFDYFNKNFGPYQYRQMRILEFPRYNTFAQSFPNTVPFAESFGWVGDFSDPQDLDYLFTVTSHEVAHQWWGHQITPSATRGANQISETMAEYASLMVMKKEYGVDAMQRFLKEELDRYLRGRANESKFEKTLLDNDTQSYVWYRKGGLVMYGLQDLVGEDSLNLQLKNYILNAKFRPKAPFTTTDEWYSYLKKATPDSLQYYLEDSFENITLYSNTCNSATYKKNDDGSYEVKIEVNSARTRYDGLGKDLGTVQKPSLLDIGVFETDTINAKGLTVKRPLVLEKVWIKPGKNTFTYKVAKLPNKAGIDPYNKMIDRIPDDNLIPVEEE
ncbi:ABC transporter permease/M1 family aminopeptidase [Croceivirga radicis]|uniref:ABC transporter permease/M1 family aminopeptidase n=1 Tax=Croceivirga radicis TaxID=1929488 RepID=UPI000255AF86|nr:M1 family aminopeptidase [Croceivirga radicis]